MKTLSNPAAVLLLVVVMSSSCGESTTPGQASEPALGSARARQGRPVPALIAFQRLFEIWVVDRDGAHKKQLTRGGRNALHYPEHCWSPDGRRIGFTSSGEISVIDVDGTNRKQLTNLGQCSIFVAWSPDGRKVLFYTGRNDGHWTLCSAEVDTGKVARLQTRHLGQDVSISPDGKRIVLGTGLRIAFDLDANTTEVLQERSHGLKSPDGQLLAFTSERNRRRWDLYVLDAGKNKQVRLTPDSLTCSGHFSWSADGRRLAFASYRTNEQGKVTGGNGIFVVNSDGTGLRRVTKGGPLQYCPVWSPDGKAIAYADQRAGNADVFVVDLAKADKPMKITEGKAYESPLAWSQDGRQIAVCSLHGGPRRVLIVDPDGRNVEQIQGDGPPWIRANEKNRFVFRVDGNVYSLDPVATAELNREGIPSHDGKRSIRILRKESGGTEVHVADINGGDRKLLVRMAGRAVRSFAWSYDDRQIVFTASTGTRLRETPLPPDDPSGIYLIDADGTGLKRLSGPRGMRPVWQPVPMD